MNLSSLLSTLPEIIAIIESIFTIAAIIVAGVWTYWLFIVKRHRHPRLELTHKVEQLALTSNKVFARVEITVFNSGEVVVFLLDGAVLIQQILPLPHPDLYGLIEDGVDIIAVLSQYNSDGGKERLTEIQWPILDSQKIQWNKGKVVIEPGEKVPLRFDFIIDQSVKTIQIHSFISSGVRYKRGRRLRWFGKNKVKTMGWNTVTICQMDCHPQPSVLRA